MQHFVVLADMERGGLVSRPNDDDNDIDDDERNVWTWRPAGG